MTDEELETSAYGRMPMGAKLIVCWAVIAVAALALDFLIGWLLVSLATPVLRIIGWR